MDAQYALTVRQPWAWAIASGHKDIENRTWRADRVLGHQILIHAGLGFWTLEEMALVNELTGGKLPTEVPVGAIVAVVTVRQFVTSSASPWYQADRVGWQLVDAVPVAVACKGAQGLWKPTPKVLREVARQYGSVVA